MTCSSQPASKVKFPTLRQLRIVNFQPIISYFLLLLLMHFHIDSFYFELANRAPGLPGKLTKRYKGTHLDILHYTKFSLLCPIWVLEFWGTPGKRGSSWRGHACVKYLPWVGGEVCEKFGGDWSGSSGVKRVQRYKQSLLYV